MIGLLACAAPAALVPDAWANSHYEFDFDVNVDLPPGLTLCEYDPNHVIQSHGFYIRLEQGKHCENTAPDDIQIRAHYGFEILYEAKTAHELSKRECRSALKPHIGGIAIPGHETALCERRLRNRKVEIIATALTHGVELNVVLVTTRARLNQDVSVYKQLLAGIDFHQGRSDTPR